MKRKGPKSVAVVLALWDTAWKAVAIRAAVRNRQYRWVPALLIVNSVGLLPIVYLWRFQHPAPAPDVEEA